MKPLKALGFTCVLIMTACTQQSAQEVASKKTVSGAMTKSCDVEFMILGVGQDAGAPQIGNPSDPAWTDPSKKLLATSAALIDHRSGERYLFEATPDIREQLQMLDEYAPSDKGPLGLSGVFLTHAHIGHYAGLMFFGRESAGTKDLPVYVMPRMKEFLENNGPWDQLISLENISPVVFEQTRVGFEAPTEDVYGTGVKQVSRDIFVMPFQVPHRDEYSETVGYVIAGPSKKVMFLPDIDDWARWEKEYSEDIKLWIETLKNAFVDATFYDDNELPGRDMSKIPHPRVTETMDMFQDAPESIRHKIHFIHINHTNPIRDPNSPESQTVRSRGYNIARRGDRVCLSE